ncbi:MAG: DUF3300 domain-containing protein [Proteobacteria bacterium]|nr:DUF3300 domain-containing protein [Pseudomonadota bacterium]
MSSFDGWRRRIRSALLCALLAVPALVLAQDNAAKLSAGQLDQLTAQIALYPDALLSQVLMAATYPADVASAAAWSRAHPDAKGDDAVKMVQDQPWDPSVQSLVAFPQVIITMGEKPDWVRNLGDAFLAQPSDVMDSVQRLRAQAQKAGNLKTNEQVTVTSETPPPPPAGTSAPAQQPQVIVIQPAQPQVVYVPTYNPTLVYGAWAYPAYPPIYVPPPPGYWFSTAVATGIAWGVSIGITNALWGQPHWGWGYGNVNINVNRYNNINVNRKLEVNNTNLRWNHNVDHRGNVPYRGGNAQRDNLARQANVGTRDNYRGRDDSRQKAAATMQNKGFEVDQAARRTANGPAGTADRAGSRAPAGADRPAVQNQNRAQTVDRDAARQRAQQSDQSALQARSREQNRDNAFRGANDANARQQIDRGNASRQAMQSRPSGGGAGARPPVQKPAGGGARAGGGGGGARGGGQRR